MVIKICDGGMVEPSTEPPLGRKSNDQDFIFVVVHSNGKNEAHLEQVIIDGNGSYLKSLNPVLEDVKVTRLAEEDQFLRVMTQAKVDYSKVPC